MTADSRRPLHGAATPPRIVALILGGVVVGAIGGGALVAATMEPAPRQAAAIDAMPGPYPYHMDSVLETEGVRPTDAAGIIMVMYSSGPEYNPVTISQSALAHYDRWLALGSKEDRDVVLKAANWLVAEQSPEGLWYYDFPNGSMPVPWVSAMAQGQGISVLVRAYAMTSDPGYADAARLALTAFDRLSDDHGVRSMDGDFVYYEETMPPYSPRILNGMVFAMYGLRDLADVLGDAHAEDLFQAGVRTLEAHIGRYDAGDWSYYNQADPPGYASRFYHGLHIQLLRELFHITGSKVFEEYADRFQGYAASPPPNVK